MPSPIHKILYLAASGLGPEERRTLLEQACRDDPGLRRRVESLFEFEDQAADFFEPDSKVPSTPPESEAAGGRIGRYRLIERIGAGGHGVVYLAEQQEPVRRKVALKIIRLGMDTEKVIARFELERQALAMMDHPNIARVLDAGATASGRPYFVMELVDGEKITRFCDERRLDIRQRLELFIKVCRAIQHAHQKGVVHRDIKSSNILVRQREDQLVPKIIDFGIAKASSKGTADDLTLTVGDGFVGTPAYMSPEIAAGGSDIDTRTDIHSLGAVLFELLTGRAPFDPERLDGLPMEEIRRILGEEDPPLPSKLLASYDDSRIDAVAGHRRDTPARLIHQMKRDLDWITMKALDRNRDRRYESAHGLALDVERHLRHEPVIAGPPDPFYRLGKLVRRNKVPFATGFLAFLALLGGLALTSWLLAREHEALMEQERLRWVAEEARIAEAGLRKKAEAGETVANAAVLLRDNDIAAADALLAQAAPRDAPASLEAVNVFHEVGTWLFEQGRWDEAADRFAAKALAFARIDKREVEAVTIHFVAATALVCDAGDDELHDRLRKVAIDRFTGTSDPYAADEVVKSCLIRPAPAEMLDELQPFLSVIEEHIGEGPVDEANKVMEAWQMLSLSLAAYRSGDFDRAEEWARRCISHPAGTASRVAAAQAVLAMSFEARGHHNEAVAECRLAGEPIELRFAETLDTQWTPDGQWFDWIIARLLLREATSGVEE